MNGELEMVLIVFGAIAVAWAIYAMVKMLSKRHSLYEEVKATSSRLAQKRAALSSKWESFHASTRTKEITYAPPALVKKAAELRQEIDGKLGRLLKPTIWRRIRTGIFQARTKFLDNKAEVLAIVGPVDWPFWLFWQVVYGLHALVNWSVYSIFLSWPSHTMRRLNRRFEYLQGLEQELDAAIESVQELTRVSMVITEKRALRDKKRAETKRQAEVTAKKRQMFEEIRLELVGALKFHLTAPTEEIVRGSSLLRLESAREDWRKDLEVFETENPGDSELDGHILFWGEILSNVQPVSEVEGEPPLSKLQRYAERVAKSERLVLSAEESFRERVTFAVLEIALKEPDTLGKARGLLSEAASHWASCEFERLTDMAKAADNLTRQALRDIDDLKQWEDIILAFYKKRADIKENEDALLAYGVELPQTSDWQTAVETLENEVPQVWASYNWPRLNDLNALIEDAFSARAQEVNRRLDAEHNKRVAKGQPLPQGAKRPSPSATPAQDNAAPAPSQTNGSGQNQEEEEGKLRIRYNPDPDHMEPLVWVQSKATRVLLQVRQSRAETGEYTIVAPNDPELVDLLRSQGGA